MKKLIFIIALLVLIPFSLNAQWEILNEGSIDRIHTFHFVNNNVGWIAGYNATLFKTTNCGDSWVNISVDENWRINQIDFINESVGWAIGSMCDSLACYGIIIKTDDGGFNWTIQKQIIGIGLKAIYVIDASNACALDENNNIYKTSNGGTSWSDISPKELLKNYNSLWFQNSDTGIVVGNYNDGVRERGLMLKTINGGSTWIQSISDEFNNITSLQFLNDTTGYFVASLDTNYFLCKTADICESWEVIKQNPFCINSFQFLNKNIAYAIIADSINYNNLMKSIDGGKTWQNVPSFDVPNFWVTNIYFWDTNAGFILGNMNGGNILFRSDNNGLNWITKNFSYPLNDLYFTNENYGFIVGGVTCWGPSHCRPDGRILETNDGGINWKIKYSTGYGIQSYFSVNDISTYYLSGGAIFKSTSNWSNWKKVNENNRDSMGYSFEANDICFLDENIGCAVGNYWSNDTSGAGVLGTLDGGENWNLIWKYPSSNDIGYNLNSISFADATGWAVGESGIIVKYTPQTGWVKQTSVTDLPLKKVFFSDENNGWITGGYKNENDFQSILLKTINNGETWGNNKLDYLINDLWFVTNQHGWAVGSDKTDKGVILESKDGGDNWTVVVDNLIGPLNSIFIKDNYAWAVGDNGLILRTANAGVTWIDDKNDKISPTEFNLEQNYPNPFNPSTTIIKYSIPKDLRYETLPTGRQEANVKLIIYDMLGREVTQLVNEQQKPGNYEVEFNASNLSSGVYFYQLKSGDFVETKKMMLMK